MKRLSLAALALLAACAPAATPAAPSGGTAPAPAVAATLKPLGNYEFAAEVEGETVTGSIEVTGEPGAYGGYVHSPAGDFPIADVTVSGQRMVVAADTPAGTLTLTMNFSGTTFTACWTLDGDSGEIRGQRTP